MELANSIVTLQPGMYILRHPKTGMPPLSLSRAAANAEHNGSIEVLFTPGTQGSVLRDGRDCVVMQVLNAPVDLLVTAYLDNVGAAIPTLKIDKIRVDGDDIGMASVHQDLPPKGLSLIGHVERRGDVVARPGETLGEPTGNLRVEGFQVMWPDKPLGVDIRYSAHVEGTEPGPLVSSGTFTGTRNAAKRLTGVRFDLAGSEAGKFELTGDAYFSGGFHLPLKTGAVLAGPTGVEHLTGLRLLVAPARGVQNKTNPWDASQRTRVLKASAKPRK